MSQKKTVFERLEDKMIELEQKIDTKLSNIQTSIEELKEEIPRSLGQNLMTFTDMLGAKIEDLEDIIKNISGIGGESPNLSVLNTVQTQLNDIKTSISDFKTNVNDLKTDIRNIKLQAPSTVISTPATTPTASISQDTKPTLATTSTPAKKAASPTGTISSKPARAIPSVVTPSVEGPLGGVLNLLDGLKQKARSIVTANELSTEMEQTRDTIVKNFRWHPALYELATFARRLKKYPVGAGVDTELQNLLLEKIDEWKKRISG